MATLSADDGVSSRYCLANCRSLIADGSDDGLTSDGSPVMLMSARYELTRDAV